MLSALRRFRQLGRWFCASPLNLPAPPASPVPYLVFPCEYPLTPYNTMVTFISPYLYTYLTEYQITYALAMPLKGQRQIFYAQSQEEFEQQMNLKKNIKPKRNKPINSHINTQFQMIGNFAQEKNGFYFVKSIEDLYPMGSICNLRAEALPLNENENENENCPLRYKLYLTAQRRFLVDAEQQSGYPPTFLIGKTVQADLFSEFTQSYLKLLTFIKQQYKSFFQPGFPKLPQQIPLKTIELLTGYLCTLYFFERDQLYALFSDLNLSSRSVALKAAYERYWTAKREKYERQKSSVSEEEMSKRSAEILMNKIKKSFRIPNEDAYVDEIRKKIATRVYPEAVLKLIEAELSSIESDLSQEVHRKKQYLNLMVDYPYGLRATEPSTLSDARRILEEDHYGMKKVKQRILEIMAVDKLKGECVNKVLLLHGPPGIGKTSIAMSIAKCLNRPYQRITLGGEHDPAILRGHRRTYMAAYPGRMFDAMMKAKVENPVILLDEIDKIASHHNGTLLQNVIIEILDPIQNYRFKDDFMDVEINLSQVLFICTANSLETIFPPLRDRLEKIELEGYTTTEKEVIFNRYIMKASMEKNGLSEELRKAIEFKSGAVKYLIDNYSRQAGVRNLQRKANKIFQRIAYNEVTQTEYSKEIGEKEIELYLGLPRYNKGLWWQETPIGVSIGMAVSGDNDGSIMYVQSSNVAKDRTDEDKKQKGELIVTGNLHEVMNESVQVAYSYAKVLCSSYFENDFLQTHDVHLNFPQIQISKDGPSAGIAIVSALLSLALNKKFIKQYAMTGEINLSGGVGAIGGVKGKVMGAKREGITDIILPLANKKNYEEIEDEIKEGISVTFVGQYPEAIKLLFGVEQCIRVQ